MRPLLQICLAVALCSATAVTLSSVATYVAHHDGDDAKTLGCVRGYEERSGDQDARRDFARGERRFLSVSIWRDDEGVLKDFVPGLRTQLTGDRHRTFRPVINETDHWRCLGARDTYLAEYNLQMAQFLAKS
jgi:hypothetical protein